MAIESTQIIDILNKEGEAAAKAEELLGLFGEDTKAQLNAVLMNKETILAEKRDSEAKRKAIEEQLQAAKAANEKLAKQLEAASPEEVKKVYDQKVIEMANIHEKKVAELNGVLDTYKTRVSDLERAQLKLECMKEFQKAAEGKNISPDAMSDLADYIMGQDCLKFDYRPVGDGKTILATKNGETIKQALEAGLQTSFGKRCIVNNSIGGGAEGASYSGGLTVNPFKKETENITEQMKLARENPELYKMFKAQAARK